MPAPLSLARTAHAIDVYDAYDEYYAKVAPTATGDRCLTMLAKLEQLGEAVGIAFGHDTADRNSMDTCRQCVRPGSKNPPAGFDNPCWIRRLVLKWRANEQEDEERPPLRRRER